MTRRAVLAALALLASAAVATASDLGVVSDGANGDAYDGRFNLVRIRWDAPTFGGFFGRGGGELRCPGREPLWAHDVCRGADQNFGTILDELTLVDARVEGRILTFDDPELFRHPLAYIVEVGYWQPTEAEVAGLRDWLLKGGFLIVDDFRGAPELRNFHQQVSRALPGVQLLPLEPNHRVWDVFFHIADPSALAPPTYPQHVPMYLGIFEDNDPDARLMVVINFNQDLGDYWEWAAEGWLPIPLTNEAFKFGVNYVIYGMTH